MYKIDHQFSFIEAYSLIIVDPFNQVIYDYLLFFA